MKSLRRSSTLKTWLAALATFLFCCQSYALSAGSVQTLTADPNLTTVSERLWAASGTAEREGPVNEPSHPGSNEAESESELEENGEKEIEDDKEEMDRNGNGSEPTWKQTAPGLNSSTDGYTAGPTLPVPTPPPDL